MAEERIQKVLSEQGLCSRREAELWIKAGRVRVNGHPVSLGDKMDPAKDVLAVDGKRVPIERKKQHLYYMLHKPRGFITTMKDELGRRSVAEFTKELPGRLLPVGRLDKDSEGLLLLTDDGEFIQKLTHPSYGVKKVYRVTLHPRAEEEKVVALARGVSLDDGTVAEPLSVRVLVDEPGRTVLELTLQEGKNREIRRMCEAVGLAVARLRRTAVGPVKLGMLQPGQVRELEPKEVSALLAGAHKSQRKNRQNAQEKV